MQIFTYQAKQAMYDGAKSACEATNKHRTTIAAAMAAIALTVVTGLFIANGVPGLSEAGGRGVSSLMTVVSVGSIGAVYLARQHDKQRAGKIIE